VGSASASGFGLLNFADLQFTALLSSGDAQTEWY
jgi:hypothetical protein